MLVLTRKNKEQIVIYSEATEIRITVLKVGHGRVKLGFDAPVGFKIARTELLRLFKQPPESTCDD